VNPVTRRLLDEVADPELAHLALAWDYVEEHIIRLYREGSCTSEQAKEFIRRRGACRRALRPWKRSLEPHWRATRVAGALPSTSPFDAVTAVARADGVFGNWGLMQQLPAAREALNGLLLERAAPAGATSL